jgi:hypothetical protein
MKRRNSKASKPTNLDRRLELLPFYPSRRWRAMTRAQREDYVRARIARITMVAELAFEIGALTDRELAHEVATRPKQHQDAADLMHVAGIQAGSLSMTLSREHRRVQAALDAAKPIESKRETAA